MPSACRGCLVILACSAFFKAWPPLSDTQHRRCGHQHAPLCQEACCAAAPRKPYQEFPSVSWSCTFTCTIPSTGGLPACNCGHFMLLHVNGFIDRRCSDIVDKCCSCCWGHGRVGAVASTEGLIWAWLHGGAGWGSGAGGVPGWRPSLACDHCV